jgi:serine/threonine-protein kinase
LPGHRRTVLRDLEAGESLDGYRLDELIGDGAMGVVFRAIRDADGQVVALKVLRPELVDDPQFRQRFAQEARAAAAVRNRHLVPILETGEADGHHYLSVAYAEGGNLNARLAETGALGVEETLRLTVGLADGLDALHAAGLVHRDIKSCNVVFDAEGVGMLTDFGLAKGRAYTVLTRPGQMVGTLHYLAPELIRGQPASPASDVYALGCTVFECLTGKTPFAEQTLFKVGLAHVEEPPPNPMTMRPDLEPALADAVLTALEKDPARRPASAGAYAALLENSR